MHQKYKDFLTVLLYIFMGVIAVVSFVLYIIFCCQLIITYHVFGWAILTALAVPVLDSIRKKIDE